MHNSESKLRVISPNITSRRFRDNMDEAIKHIIEKILFII